MRPGTTSPHNTFYPLMISSRKGDSVVYLTLFDLLLTFALFRLNRQHCVIRRACGGKLYFAPIHLHDGDRVLESGVGTGTL